MTLDTGQNLFRTVLLFSGMFDVPKWRCDWGDI